MLRVNGVTFCEEIRCGLLSKCPSPGDSSNLTQKQISFGHYGEHCRRCLPNTCHHPEVVTPTVKNDGNSGLLWGAFVNASEMGSLVQDGNEPCDRSRRSGSAALWNILKYFKKKYSSWNKSVQLHINTNVVPNQPQSGENDTVLQTQPWHCTSVKLRERFASYCVWLDSSKC